MLTAPGTSCVGHSEAVDPDDLYEVAHGVRVKRYRGARELLLANKLDDIVIASCPHRDFGFFVVAMLFQLSREPWIERRPDFAFVSYDRWPEGREINSGDAWNVVPDWAVEVVSPSNPADELVEKVQEYFAAGSSGSSIRTWRRCTSIDRRGMCASSTEPEILTGRTSFRGFKSP